MPLPANEVDSPDGYVRTALWQRHNLLAIAPDGSWLAIVADGTAQIWGVDGKLRANLSGHPGRVKSIIIAPDGSWLYARSSWRCPLVIAMV